MKKTMLIFVMGLCGTAVFAQNANVKPTINQEQVQSRPGAMLKAKRAKSDAPVKSSSQLKQGTTKSKVKVMKTAVMSKGLAHSAESQKAKIK